jgi:large subunit ribosomal protein L7Ae
MAAMYVRFEAPRELQDKSYESVENARDSGEISKGANEVTKAIERGEADLVVMAQDVQPEEVLAHVPLLCEEKDVAYTYVHSKDELGVSAGLEVATSAVAVTDPGRSADLVNQVTEQAESLQE